MTTSAPDRTEVGSYFVANYPPFSVWTKEAVQTDARPALASAPGDVPLGLYLHIPFCRKRCHFCYFRVYTDKNSTDVERYVAALSREIELVSRLPAMGGRPGSRAAAWRCRMACRRRNTRSSSDVRRSRARRCRAPTRVPARRDSPAPRTRSCRCTRGNNRSGNASGRTGCGDTVQAEHRPAPTRALAWRPSGPRPSSRRRTGGSWRRSSCRLPCDLART